MASRYKQQLSIALISGFFLILAACVGGTFAIANTFFERSLTKSNPNLPTPTPNSGEFQLPLPSSTKPVSISPANTPASVKTTNVIKISNSDLPQQWEGTYKQGQSVYPMILRIEEIKNGGFSGYLSWPTLRNSITAMNGKVVTDFGDFIEQSKWKYIDSYGKVTDGEWVIFTETELIQGNSIVLNGLYYAYISEDGVMEGAWFSNISASEPGGTFSISLVKN